MKFVKSYIAYAPTFELEEVLGVSAQADISVWNFMGSVSQVLILR